MSDEPSGLTMAQFAELVTMDHGGQTTEEILAGAERMAAAIRLASTDRLAALSDERSPYRTGVCPSCGEPVEIEQLNVSQPGGYSKTVFGRWKCRTVGCRLGEPA